MAKRNEKVKEKKIRPLEFEDLANEFSGVVEYPLRDSKEDPLWAVNTVRLWTGIVLSLVVAITALLVLGAIYD
jgi:hypothetical protein